MKKDGVWGTEVEISAFATMKDSTVLIFRCNELNQIILINYINDGKTTSTINILFRNSNGIIESGNHYVALLPKNLYTYLNDSNDKVNKLKTQINNINENCKTEKHDNLVTDLIESFSKLDTPNKNVLLNNLNRNVNYFSPSKNCSRPRILKFSENFKEQVVVTVNKTNNNLATANQFGIAESTVSHWRQRMTEAKDLKKYKKRKQKRMKNVFFQRLESMLIIWFIEIREKKITIDNLAIQKKALGISETLKMEKLSFKASITWLENFKKRFKIVGRRPTYVTHKLVENAGQEIQKFMEEVKKFKFEEIKRNYLKTEQNTSSEKLVFIKFR
jgi:hypothetical protein